jgi:hypothetical protein
MLCLLVRRLKRFAEDHNFREGIGGLGDPAPFLKYHKLIEEVAQNETNF